MSLILGSHMSIANGFLAAAREAVENMHANAMQCFVRNPRSGSGKPIRDDAAAEFRAYAHKQQLTVVVHSPYIINFSKPYSKNEWAVNMYADDLRRCDQLGARGAVLHMGKALGQMHEKALSTMAETVKRVLVETKTYAAQVIIENTAGQGTEIGYRFEEIGELFRRIGKQKRLMCCFDTAHAFAAGYDMCSDAAWRKTRDAFEHAVGWKRVGCIQLNDSMKACGSRVDRHANIGTGLIGISGILRVVRFAKRHSIPLLLETPLGEDGMAHHREVRMIQRRIK